MVYESIGTEVVAFGVGKVVCALKGTDSVPLLCVEVYACGYTGDAPVGVTL